MHCADDRAGTMIVLVLLCECAWRACPQHEGDNKGCTRCAFHGSTSMASDVSEIATAHPRQICSLPQGSQIGFGHLGFLPVCPLCK